MYVVAIFQWMLQKHCACYKKVKLRHTNSCNCHAKWSLQRSISVTWNLQPFHRFSARGLKHRHHRIWNIPVRVPREKHHFGPSSNPPRVPTFLQPSRTPAPATYFATCQNHCLPRKTQFEPPKTIRDRQFWTFLISRALATAWCKFSEAELPKAPRHCQFFNDFDFQIALVPQRGANFADILGSRSSATRVFGSWLCEPSKLQNVGKTQHFAQLLPAKIPHVSHLYCRTSLLSNTDAARPSGNFQYSRKLGS